MTLDLTSEHYEALNSAIDETGGSMAEYLRALIELYSDDPQLAERTAQQMKQMRQARRRRRTPQSLAAA
ncbi:hypothetical protein [Streptomyces albiaxialis]|uniref:hypothetical protein n=1 Tax=Streptomyces albiaxialis TaxID=329523 RepID=UPI0031D9F144